MPTPSRRVVVSGASGLIGSALCAELSRSGYGVERLVRRSASADGEITWDPMAGTIDATALDGASAIVHLAGAGIGDRRWTDQYKSVLVESRTRSTDLLASTIARLEQPPLTLLSGSAVGFYGPNDNSVLDESSPAGTGFLADLCQRWEAAAAPASAAGVRTVFLRTGMVLSRRGGALKKQLPLFRLGLGGRFGNGKPWQSWISIADEVGAIMHLLTSQLSGPVNLVAPGAVTGTEFARVLGQVLKRPAVFPIPAFGPRLLLGRELADALLFTGARVTPAALLGDGYAFRYPDLDSALRAALAS